MPIDLTKIPFKPRSYIFAPMEGVTNGIYRQTIRTLYPEWDALCADFLRIPSNGLYPLKFIRKHIGEDILNNPSELKRTMVQILTSPKAKTLETVSQLVELGVYWIDLNIGCPSGTVVKHQGGAYWLNNLDSLKELVKNIRKIHPHFFSVKMRLGFNSTNDFIQTIKMLESEGVDALTIHARTREQMYKDQADWDFIRQAVETVNIPIIGNGDIWNLQDAKKVFDTTHCHSVMIARGALKKPWLVQSSYQEDRHQIKNYFTHLISAWKAAGINELTISKKIKEFSRYIFEDLIDGVEIKRKILLAQSLQYQETQLYYL